MIQSITQPEQPVDGPNMDYINNWVDENEWFDRDIDLRHAALLLYEKEIIKSHGVDNPRDILPKVLVIIYMLCLDTDRALH